MYLRAVQLQGAVRRLLALRDRARRAEERANASQIALDAAAEARVAFARGLDALATVTTYMMEAKALLEETKQDVRDTSGACHEATEEGAKEWKAADAHQEGEAEVIAAAEEAEQAAIHKAESTIDHAHKDVEEIKAIILIAKESVSACFIAAKDAKAEAKVARGAADWKDSCQGVLKAGYDRDSRHGG